MTTLNLTLAANADDMHEGSFADNSGKAPTGSTLVSDGAILSPGSHGSNDEYSAACRFTGVTIPQGATITSASFSMRGNSTYNASPNVIKFHVSCQAADNAAALSTASGNLNSTTRARTTADTAWTQTSVTGGSRSSVDITTAVQEVINRAGWASGNALVVLVDTHADTTAGEWQDYDAYNTGGATNGPKLDIDYTVGGGSAVVLSQARLPQALLAR